MMVILCFLSFVISAGILCFLAEQQVTTESLRFKITLSHTEIFESDYFCYTEIIENISMIPIRCVRVDTTLSHGLEFVIDGKTMESISEILHIGPRQQIKRVWKVRASKRGVYKFDKITLIAPSMLGSRRFSKITTDCTSGTELTVLPAAVRLEDYFTKAGTNCEIESKLPTFMTDPIIKSSVREYTTSDPFPTINWKMTASHGRLLVNSELPYVSRDINILINLQSRPFERDELVPSNPHLSELSITVAASLISRLNNSGNSFSMATNVKYPSPEEHRIEVGSNRYFSLTPKDMLKSSIIPQLEILAEMGNELTCTAKELFMGYSELLHKSTVSPDNLIVISPFFDAVLAEFHSTVTAMQIPVIYFLVSGRNDVAVIPSDAEIYYYTNKI